MTEEIKKRVSEFIDGIFKNLPIKKKKLAISVQKLEGEDKKSSKDNENGENSRDVFIVEVSFSTDAPELLIGYHGKNLQAFRTILQTFLNTFYPDYDVRVALDIDNYFAQQLEKLTKRVRQTIEEVRLLGEPVELKPMSPRFRRHVHLIVADTPGVYSESKGTGRARRVVIYPLDDDSENKE